MAARAACAALVLLVWGNGVGEAQDARLLSEPADSASRVIARVLERGDYLLLDRDTILGREASIDRDLVVAQATVRLEGAVHGSVLVLGGELYIRPGAVVTGPIAVAGGAAYTSALAELGPIIEVPLQTTVDVARDPEGYAVTLTQPPPPRRLAPSGVFGIAIPTYDRVDGLTVGWGTRFLLDRSDGGAYMRGAVTYATRRNRVGGTASVEVPIGGGTWLAAGVSRRTVTNERWIRGDLLNSLAAVTFASDARDYHESDAVTVGVYRRPTQPLIQGESFIGPRLVLRASRDRSLEAGDPWSLTGDDWRVNPPVDDGTITSVIGGVAFGWRGATSSLDGDAAFEWAPPAWSDHEVAQIVAEGDWSMAALWNHRIDLYSRVAHAFGDDPMPRQRWTFVGGAGTLPTFEYGDLRGDNLLFIRSSYTVPVPRLRVPMLGPLSVHVAHAAGSAWATGQPRPPWEQNLGVGTAVSVVSATVWVDPAVSPLDPVVAFSLSLGL